MKIGIYGGSFDPIHTAHLILAECAADSLGLDQVRFIPTSVSPFKQAAKPSEDKHRLEMIRLAIGGNSRFALDAREVDRGGVSYTIDTVKSLKAEFPESELWILMGSDSVVDFGKWRSPAELLQLTKLAVMVRPDTLDSPSTVDWSGLQAIANKRSAEEIGQAIPAPQLEISSSDLRSRCQSGRSIRYQVPASVQAYIQEHGLYRK
jgi:nicotinate-nucleotide adenylyltransferase